MNHKTVACTLTSDVLAGTLPGPEQVFFTLTGPTEKRQRKYNIFIGTYIHLCLQVMNDLPWAQRINGMRFLNLGFCSSILSWYLRKYRNKFWSKLTWFYTECLFSNNTFCIQCKESTELPVLTQYRQESCQYQILILDFP